MDKETIREIFAKSAQIPSDDEILIEEEVNEYEVLLAGLLFLVKGLLDMDEDSFVEAYGSVKGIVRKLAREFYIKLWSGDDWQQEAQIILYQLLEKFPELMHDEDKLRGYFKTKFRSYVLDNLRKQESYKRAFDKMLYEEISEMGHMIPDHKMDTADYCALKEKLEELKKKLSPEDYKKLLLLMRGGAFKGKRAFIKDIKVEFDDWNSDK
ncbi:sigma-70 family RNA polymerase sigma factor [Streptococcus dentapri]|uniref:Sigma-70 family RNA polymerase sigma factor n=1 Tax=Streptococcus dentapri TaxID=573564 RepID=A0ABV8D3I4_9STRE